MSGNIQQSDEDRRYADHLTAVASRSTVSNLKLRRAPAKVVLTPREIQIVILICDSYSSKEIGVLLSISARTVETHRIHLMKKLNLDCVLLLHRWAIQQGVVPPVCLI